MEEAGSWYYRGEESALYGPDWSPPAEGSAGWFECKGRVMLASGLAAEMPPLPAMLAMLPVTNVMSPCLAMAWMGPFEWQR